MSGPLAPGRPRANQLVVQALFDPTPHVSALAEMTGCSGYEPIGDACAYRFFDATLAPGLAGWCESRQLDWAFVAREHGFDNIGLVAFDMDATLISEETLDELASLAGK